MEYKPRYAQPFSLEEAKGLDVQTITEEIARLQNSLQRLGETQTMLRDYVAATQPNEEVDPEITKAIEENETVIGSQTERISILKMALLDKGIVAGSHYDVPLPSPPVAPAPATTRPAGSVEEDAGVDL